MTTARTRSKKAETPEPFTLPTVVASLADATNGDEARAWFEDKVVRSVREQGYCYQALRVMDSVFGEALPTHLVYDTSGTYGDGRGSKNDGKLYAAYVDSDGVDCWGNVWRDLATARDRDGFDRNGRDADGYDKEGFDSAGFNREGLDKDGISRDDPNRYRFDVHGWDKDGFNRNGFGKDGYNREGLNAAGEPRPTPPAERFAFDANGRDIDGYDASGYRADGKYSEDVYLKYRLLMRRG